ncbi:transcriptional regulator [Actinomadura craniellae]|uniref:Transcriptional regulator n=1 Tax=Actinomadura craniellae TaxID=2231787 RepID=A0A365GW15_9ACTN|nr:helix-turn-helix transcriptional regulator [Actinomadura craniellae]RAY10995.1 transcriptional regulator [Actinomadura craniellae]
MTTTGSGRGGTSAPTVRLRRLGRAMRRIRETRHLTLEEAGAGMERSISSLSKFENGRIKLPARDVKAMLAFYEVDDQATCTALLTLARDSHKRGWWQQYGDVVTPSYADFISLEADAAAIRGFETILIPGLLQTEDYARAVMTAVPGLSGPLNIDQLVAVRMARRSILERENPPRIWMILDEAALHRHIGGAGVMRSQLLHVIEIAELDHVVVQVMPYEGGAHAGTAGPFTILEFPELADLDVVLVESLTSGLYLETEDEIRRYNLVFDHLRMSALPEAASKKLIRQVAQKLQ